MDFYIKINLGRFFFFLLFLPILYGSSKNVAAPECRWAGCWGWPQELAHRGTVPQDLSSMEWWWWQSPPAVSDKSRWWAWCRESSWEQWEMAPKQLQSRVNSQGWSINNRNTQCEQGNVLFNSSRAGLTHKDDQQKPETPNWNKKTSLYSHVEPDPQEGPVKAALGNRNTNCTLYWKQTQYLLSESSMTAVVFHTAHQLLTHCSTDVHFCKLWSLLVDILGSAVFLS